MRFFSLNIYNYNLKSAYISFIDTSLGAKFWILPNMLLIIVLFFYTICSSTLSFFFFFSLPFPSFPLVLNESPSLPLFLRALYFLWKPCALLKRSHLLKRLLAILNSLLALSSGLICWARLAPSFNINVNNSFTLWSRICECLTPSPFPGNSKYCLEKLFMIPLWFPSSHKFHIHFQPKILLSW